MRIYFLTSTIEHSAAGKPRCGVKMDTNEDDHKYKDTNLIFTIKYRVYV